MCESESRGPANVKARSGQTTCSASSVTIHAPQPHVCILSHPTSASRPRHQRSGNLKISLYSICCKVIYGKENTMVDDIKNIVSRVNQYLVIQCPFPLVLILGFIRQLLFPCSKHLRVCLATPASTCVQTAGSRRKLSFCIVLAAKALS